MTALEEFAKNTTTMKSVQPSGTNGDDLFYFVGVALCLMVMYSLTINILFGHRTYWRSADEWRPSKLLASLFRNSFVRAMISESLLIRTCQFSSPKYVNRSNLRVSERCCENSGKKRLDVNSTVCRNTSTELQSKLLLSNLDSNLTVHLLTFLSAADIVETSRTNKRMRILCEAEYLWREKWRELSNSSAATSLCNESKFLCLGQSGGKITFFRACHQMWQQLLREDLHGNAVIVQEEDNWPHSCRVSINGDIYELRPFLRDHPGGAAILLEFRGEDGTRVFQLAAHSKYARAQMKQYEIWSQMDILGRKGWPAIILSSH